MLTHPCYTRKPLLLPSERNFFLPQRSPSNMATKPPKKKWQFFGQTASDLSTASDDHINSPRPLSSYETSSGDSTRDSSPFQMLSLHSPPPVDYSTSLQPIYAPTPIHPQDYSHPALAAVSGHYSPGLQELPPPHYGGGGYSARFVPADVHIRDGESVDTTNGEAAASSSCYTLPDDDDGANEVARGLLSQGGCSSLSKGGSSVRSKGIAGARTSSGSGRCQKRPQRCRMCANHGLLVDMKGHKWYCPFRECPCGDCEITRKTQYYMKERQKLTRHQQQQLNEEREPPETLRGAGQEPLSASDTSSRRRGGPGSSAVFDQNQMDFPRVDEMVSQTKNILDYELFEKVNQACRPRSSSGLPPN